ncbi:hypothetical protein HAX54_037014, partial [Datura stramonium]|nr:hypothetical protein [Datura stramonium]
MDRSPRFRSISSDNCPMVIKWVQLVIKSCSMPMGSQVLVVRVIVRLVSGNDGSWYASMEIFRELGKIDSLFIGGNH